jgi:hypothetical protein
MFERNAPGRKQLQVQEATAADKTPCKHWCMGVVRQPGLLCNSRAFPCAQVCALVSYGMVGLRLTPLGVAGNSASSILLYLIGQQVCMCVYVYMCVCVCVCVFVQVHAYVGMRQGSRHRCFVQVSQSTSLLRQPLVTITILVLMPIPHLSLLPAPAPWAPAQPHPMILSFNLPLNPCSTGALHGVHSDAQRRHQLPRHQ